MAVGLKMVFDAMTVDDYDAVCSALNFPADWPDGLLAHSSADVDGVVRVIDTWESREKFDAFAQSRLGPAMGEAMGDRAERPQIKERPLHTFYTQEAVPA